jgi:hypothetical protein
MLTAAMLALTVTVLGLSVLTTSMSSNRLAAIRRDRAIAFDLAEAGLSHAVATLRTTPTYTGQANTSFGSGFFRVAVTTPAANSNLRNVVATGRVVSVNGAFIEQSVTGNVSVFAPHPVWKYAIITEQPLTFVDRVKINSTPITNQGHVHSNTSLSLGSIQLNGRASSAGPINTGTTTPTLGSIAHGPRVELPTIDKDALLAAATAKGVTTGNVAASSGTVTLRGKIVGNVNITGNQTNVIIDGPVWVTGTIALSGRSWTGNGAMVAEGTITISTATSSIAPSIIDLAMCSFSTSSSAIFINITNNSGGVNVRGAMFAPNGGVRVLGMTSILGSIVAKSAALDGQGAGVDVTRDGQFRPPLGYSTQLQYWAEL